VNSSDGALSIPFRLAISAVVLSMTMPICIDAIADEKDRLSENASIYIAEKIARTASDLSFRPVGESREIRIEKHLALVDSDILIIVGDIPGERNSSVVRCIGNDGWKRIISPRLGAGIQGICSRNGGSFIIHEGSHDLRMEHTYLNGKRVLMMEGA